MQYILDYIAAAIMGATLLVIMNSANDVAYENHSLYNGDMLVQEMLVQTAYLLEGELRNMGVGVPEKENTVLYADSSRLRFVTDIDLNGVIDTVEYFAGTPSEMAETQNELDRPLYRRINGSSAMVVGAVTVFQLRYLTQMGEILAMPVSGTRLTEIHSVEITMEVQNPYALSRAPGTVGTGERGELYSSSLWQQTRLASQNTRR